MKNLNIPESEKNEIRRKNTTHTKVVTNTPKKKTGPSWLLSEPEMLYGLMDTGKMPDSVKFSILKDIPVETKVVTTAIGITDKTFRSYLKSNKELPPVQGEWVMKYKELQEFGVDLFGSEKSFDKWLNKYSIRLETIPKNLLYSVQGVQNTIEELTRLSYGYPT